MHKRMLALLAVLALSLSLPATAQTIAGVVNKAYLQALGYGWATADLEQAGRIL